MSSYTYMSVAVGALVLLCLIRVMSRVSEYRKGYAELISDIRFVAKIAGDWGDYYSALNSEVARVNIEVSELCHKLVEGLEISVADLTTVEFLLKSVEDDTEGRMRDELHSILKQIDYLLVKETKLSIEITDIYSPKFSFSQFCWLQ